MSNNKTLRRGALASTLLVIVVVGGMIGCAAKRVVLVPAPNAIIATGPDSAEASSNGVQMVVQADAWNGRPRDLDTKVTPLKVTIQNHSGNPLAIRYKAFVLLSSLNDQHYAAIPPFDIRGTEYVSQLKTGPQLLPAYVEQQAKPHPALVSTSSEPPRPNPLPRRTRVIITPEFGWDHFYVAPWWGCAYPGIGFWGSPWAPDWGYYGLYYPYWQVQPAYGIDAAKGNSGGSGCRRRQCHWVSLFPETEG